jgi:hypothetical protein
MTITINGTTGIAGVDGSAGTPAVQGADTNTGMFFPAADTIAFTTGGTEDMRIDSGGNVGIGTTSPSTYGQFAVYTAASNTEIAAVTGGANYATYRLQNSSKRYSMQIRTDQSNAWTLRDETAGANRIMVRDSDGVIFIPSVYATTNAAAANVYVGSDGFLGRSTSSLKYKRDVQDATHGLADVLKLRSVTFKSKSESNGDLVFGGFIAEEVDALGLTEFVQYADDESPDALAYGNMVSLLTKAIQEQQALITSLTARITALEQA